MKVGKHIKKVLMLIFFTYVFSTVFFNGHYIQIGTTADAANTSNLYYFNRYTAVKDRVQGTWSEKRDFTKTWADFATVRMWSGYSWDPENKRYVGSGEYYDTTGYGTRQNNNNFLATYKYEIIMGGYCVEWHFGNCIASELWTEDKDVQGNLLQANIVALDGTYPDNGIFSDGYWYIKGSRVNSIPTITANLTTEKRIFSEKDPIMTVSGTFNDSDTDDIVSVKYRVDGNAGQPSAVITSAVPGSIAKSYTQSMNTEYLSEGIHTVYVWAEDNNGGVSPESAVTFFIDKSAPVLQRPVVTVDGATQITVSANATDPAVEGVGSGLDANPFQYNKNGTDVGTWQAGKFADTGLLPNTKYIYKYKARDKAKNISEYSGEVACYTLANTPANLRTTDSGMTSVALAWDPNGNPEGTKYELYCKETGTIVYVGTSTSFIHTGKSEGSTCTYKVRAVNGDSVPTSYTSEVTYRINAQPDSVKACTVNVNDIAFTWSSNGNPAGTEYEAQLIKRKDSTVIGTKIITATAVSFTGLYSNTEYTLKVRSKISGNNYTGYAIYSVHTAANSTAITLDNVTQTSVKGSVSLNGNPIGTEVLVVRSTNAAFSSYVTVKDWNTGTDFIDTNLIGGTTYYYRAMARNGDNVLTEWSATQKTLTKPSAPHIISAQATGVYSIKISWNIVGGANNYHVYRDGKLIASTATDNFTDSELEPNTKHVYTVAANNASGESGASDAVSQFTLAANPSDTVITSSVKNAVSISIKKDLSNGADPEYKVEIKPVGGGETVASDWLKQTELTLAGLSEDTEYELWVTTRNGDYVENTPVKMITGLKTNNTPRITVSNTSTTASAIAPYNTVTLGGICYDADNEPVTISAVIDGVSKTMSLRPAPTKDPGADNWSLSWDGSELGEGRYTNIIITAEDVKAGISTTLYTGTIVIDKTGPSAMPVLIPSTTAPTTGPIVVKAQNFGDAVNKEYRIDGGNWIPYTGPVTITSNCAIEVRGLDEYKNPSKIGTIAIKNIDKDPPSSPTIHVSNENWTSSDVTVTVIEGVDSVSGVSQSRIKIGNGEWEEYKAPVTISAEGITTVSAITIDNLGQTSMETSIQVKIDHTAPKIDRIYIEKGQMYVTASDNIGLNAAAYKYKLKATSSIKDVEAVENSSDPFKLALLIEADRNLENQSTPWIQTNYLSGVKDSDKYQVFVRDLAGNTESAIITINRTAGTIYGQLTPEELKELQNQQTKNNDSNNSSNKKETEKIEQIQQKEAVKEAEKALKDVITVADNTPVNSQTGQITVDLSNMLKTMAKTTSPIYNSKCRLELTQKKTGALIYSKILNNTSKIVIPDLDDATTYIIRLVILDQDGKEIKDKSFEQTTPDRTPPVITALKTENNNLEVKAIDNAGLASNAYKYQLISVNITTASRDSSADFDAVKRTAKILADNTWSMDTWTNSSKLENVQANMVIKTVVRDASGNTTEQIVVIENTDKEYVNLINADNPYILSTGSTGNIKNYFNTMGDDAEYSINDPSIAQIDALGNISALKSGEAVVTAKNIKTGEIKQLLIRIRNVSALSIRRIIVEKDSVTNIKLLYKDQLISELGSLDNLEWICEDSAIGDLSSDGQFTAKKNGTTRVIISKESKTMLVYVIVAQAGSLKSDVQEIHIQAPYLINKGTGMQLNDIVKCLDFKDRSININEFTVFEVSDEKVLKLGKDGSILALAEGAAEITAVDLINNIFAKIKVNVVDVTPVKTGFTDVSGHWAEKFFSTEVTKSIIRGYSDKQFKPDNKVTNNEFLIMLSKTMQLKGQPHLTDRTQMRYDGLNMNDPVYNYAANVLINVRPIYSTLVFGGKMKDMDTISRGEAAELIMALTQGKLEHKVKKYDYKDLQGAPHEDALRYCIETGIYTGCSKNMISGQKTLSRAEMLVVMNRLAEVK